MSAFRAGSWYRSPIVVAVVQALLISLVANSIAQFIACFRSGEWKYDILQTLRFFALNLVLVPMNYNWEIWLEWRFPSYYETPQEAQLPFSRPEGDRKPDGEVELLQYRDSTEDASTSLLSPGTSQRAATSTTRKPAAKFHVVNTIIKLVLDAFTIGIFVNILVILLVMGFLKGHSRAETATEIRTKMVPMVVDSFKLWPAATVIAFIWIRVEKRVVFFQFIGLIWGIYVSLVAA